MSRLIAKRGGSWWLIDSPADDIGPFSTNVEAHSFAMVWTGEPTA
ncbi:hypothetical protein [Agromyces atrinae]|nr:hypothetical protein [Agromyces atrinae]